MRHDESVAVARGDEGTILLIVLFVTTVLAVLIGVVLTNVEVNLRNTTVAENLADKTYAADGGVEYVVQRLRQDPNSCSDPNLGPWVLNSTSVTLSCTPVTSATPTNSGWAVVTTAAGSASLSTRVDPSFHSVKIKGPTYVSGGLNLASDLTVENGPLLQANPCPVKTGTLNGAITCTNMPVPVGKPALPCLASCGSAPQYSFVDRAPTASYTTGSGCSVFLPGRYAAPPILGPRNYFASGVYYFEFTGTIDVNGREVAGGAHRADEAPIATPACADDNTAGVSDGTGVEWILGGGSAILVGSTSGTSFELFARQPGSSAEGAAGISIRGVPTVAPPPGYTPSTTNIFSNAGGTSTSVGVHGMLYAPDAAVVVAGTGSVGSEFSGGIVASTLTLDPAGVATGSFGMVSSPAPPAVVDHQVIAITATASGGGTTKDVITRAVIELSNDANRSVVIDSWATNAA